MELQYRRDPDWPPDGSTIWVAREGPAIISRFAAMPVRVQVQGQEIARPWGTDVGVAPERG